MRRRSSRNGRDHLRTRDGSDTGKPKSIMPTDLLTGGCLCGAIRYEIARVFDAGYCHCSRCRKATGGAVLAWAYVEADAFQLKTGQPRVYVSSAEGSRAFCGECGSPLWFTGAEGTYYSVHVGTLDDPERVPPQIHQCIETKLGWLALADDLPRVEGNTLPHPDARQRS